MEQHITFTDTAAHNYLNGIAAASIVFGNANDLFVFGQTTGISAAAQFQIQQINGIQRSSVADGQTGTDMAMKFNCFFPKNLIFVNHRKKSPLNNFIHQVLFPKDMVR